MVLMPLVDKRPVSLPPRESQITKDTPTGEQENNEELILVLDEKTHNNSFAIIDDYKSEKNEENGNMVENKGENGENKGENGENKENGESNGENGESKENINKTERKMGGLSKSLSFGFNIEIINDLLKKKEEIPDIILISVDEFNEKYKRRELSFPTQTNREKNLEELLLTERTYVRKLNICQEIHQKYMSHLSKYGKIPIKEDDINMIFGNIKDIISINTLLLDDIEKRFDAWDRNKTVGDIIKKFCPFLRMYTTYTTNFNKAMTLLNQTQSNSMGFINVLDYLRDLPLCENLELGSFLILPVQRIPRYVLLLTDLISNTANTHEDYSLLNESLTLMKTVADELDYAIQDEENRNKCFEIQKLLGNSIQIVEAYRRLIHEGELYKQCRKDRKLRKFWLFNDMMICGFFQPTLLRYQHRKIELSTLAISDIPDDPEKNILNAIEISDYSKSFLVYTKTFDEKVNWLVILQNSIVEYKKKEENLDH